MNKEDIIKMAKEANLQFWDTQEIECFAGLVAANEREECADIALTGTGEPMQTDTLRILKKERERIASAIFERGNN